MKPTASKVSGDVQTSWQREVNANASVIDSLRWFGAAQVCRPHTLQSSVALFCSVRCPGKLILDTYDLCQTLRSAAIPVISGFHSPMEQECLRILLKSENRVIWCLARGMLSRMPPELRDPINEGRLLVCTPFQDSVRRITADTASRRNRVVAELAERVVVSHASPGSKMEALSKTIIGEGKLLFTFEHPANKTLLAAGAKRIEDLNLTACSKGSESS